MFCLGKWVEKTHSNRYIITYMQEEILTPLTLDNYKFINRRQFNLI